MIRVLRKRGGEGHGMYRAYCEDCTKYLHGQARSRHMYWWMAQAGAERAADGHQLQHEALKAIGKRPMKLQEPCPNSGEYLEVSAIPIISVTLVEEPF